MVEAILYGGKRYKIISSENIVKRPGTKKTEIIKAKLLTKDFKEDKRSKNVYFRSWTSVGNKKYISRVNP